jgi:hypothetical protein
LPYFLSVVNLSVRYLSHHNILYSECKNTAEWSPRSFEGREEDFQSFALFPHLFQNKVASTNEDQEGDNKNGERGEEDQWKDHASEEVFDGIHLSRVSEKEYQTNQDDLELGTVSSSGTICAVLKGKQFHTYKRNSPKKNRDAELLQFTAPRTL